MRRRRLWLLFLTAMLSGPACQQRQAVVAGEPASATAPAIPAKAKLALAEVPPRLARPVDAPGADKLSEEALAIVRAAEALLLKGQASKAVPQFEKAKALAPQSPRVRRGLGMAYAGLGDQVKAEAELRASLVKGPNRAQVHLLLGRYAVARGEFDKALGSFRRGLLCTDADDTQPDTAELLVRLATLLANQGYWTAALDSYDRLGKQLSANPRGYDKRAILRLLVSRPERIMLARGRLLLKLQRADEAAKLLERAYRRDKTHRQAARSAVDGLLAAGRFDRAERIVMELLDEASMRDLAIESAVKLCRTTKDAATPQRLLKAYLDRGGSNGEFVIAMAEAAAELGAADAAADMLSAHLASSPDDAGTALRLASLRAKGGDFAAAAGYYAKLLAADAANLDRVAEAVRRLARYEIDAKIIEALPAKAGQDPPAPAAMLCVAGMMAEATGRTALAGRLLTRAVTEHPKFWPAYEVLEAHHAAAGDLDALDALDERVAKAAGKGHFRHYLGGKIRLDQGRVEDAVDSLEEARSLRGGHVPTLLLLGRAYARKGNERDAERRLLAGQALGPADADVAAELFDLYVRRGGRTEAGRVVARFLRDNPQSAAGKLMAARYYLLIRRPEKAREIVDKLVVGHGDDVEVRLFDLRLDLPPALADEPLPAGDARAALAKVDEVLKLDPHSADARKLKAVLLSNQSRHDEAAAVLAPVFRRRRQDAVVAGAYLNALIKAGKAEAAGNEVRKIAARKRLATPMKLVALDALRELEDYAAAEKLLTRWLAAPTDNTELGRLRVRALSVYEAAKHYDAAQGLIDRWIDSGLEPETLLSWLRLQKLRVFVLAGKLDQAQAYAAKFTAKEWTPYGPRREMVLTLVRAKSYAAAHKLLDAWAAEPKGDRAKLSEARGIVVSGYAEHKMYDDLVKTSRKWIAADCRDDEAHRLAVVLLSRDDKHAEAVKLAEQWLAAVEKLPASTSAPAAAEPLKYTVQRVIVELLVMAEKKRDALRRARAYLRADPESPVLMRAVMTALHANEKEKEYVEIMERLYKLDEDDPGVNNDLGYSWADRGINLPQAEAMIRKALAARPGEVAFKDSLGWVFYKQGKFAAAERIFDQAAGADEIELHPVILDHAGDNCWRLGRTEKAVKLWGRAVRLAEKEKTPDREVRQVLAETPAKIKAAESAGKPKVAPLGKGVPDPAVK